MLSIPPFCISKFVVIYIQYTIFIFFVIVFHPSFNASILKRKFDFLKSKYNESITTIMCIIICDRHKFHFSIRLNIESTLGIIVFLHTFGGFINKFYFIKYVGGSVFK